jgi:hypothetical protein
MVEVAVHNLKTDLVLDDNAVVGVSWDCGVVVVMVKAAFLRG